MKTEDFVIKAQAIVDFKFSRFKEINIISRKMEQKEGKLFEGDIFTCNVEIANYLIGNNSLNQKVINIIEIIPEIKSKKKNNK